MTSYEDKQDKQAMMRMVARNGQKLFSLCQVETEAYAIVEPWIGARLLEKLFYNKHLHSFFRYLNHQIVAATEKLEEKNNRLRHLEEENKELKEQCNQAKAEQQALNDTLLSLREQLENQSQEPTAVPETPVESTLKTERKWIEGMISLRDGLQVKLDFLQDTAPEEVRSQKMIVSLLEQTAVLLKGNGVTILDESGALDKSRHVVQDVEYTTDETLDNQIAKTFRSGYQYGEACIRGQEVIVYVYKGV